MCIDYIHEGVFFQIFVFQEILVMVVDVAWMRQMATDVNVHQDSLDLTVQMWTIVQPVLVRTVAPVSMRLLDTDVNAHQG